MREELSGWGHTLVRIHPRPFQKSVIAGLVDLSLSASTQLGKLLLLPYGNDQSSPQGLENGSLTLTASTATEKTTLSEGFALRICW